MAQVYQELGVTYLHCHDVYDMTVGQVMELAALSSGGYLLALDGQDYYGTFCGKSNWVSEKIVTCWASPKNTTTTTNNNNPLALSTSCKTSKEPLDRLLQYMLQSANNPATDDRYTLGPPQTLYDTPLNEIQALWQVSTRSAALGMAHFSSILDDNRQSRLNERLVDMVYEERFEAISLLAVDNVALNGNALLSVLRNSCGQTNLPACGQGLSPPRIQPYGQVSQRVLGFCVAAFLIGFVFWFGCKLYPTLWTKLMERWKMILRKDVSQKPKTPNNSSLNDPGNTWHPSTGLLV
jgi:hypothetical protein